jgi:apolipoprotein N-acyltransferase
LIVLRVSDRFPLRPLLGLALGMLHAGSFRSDAGWPLEIAALAGLFALAERVDWKGAATLGFAFGLGWFVTGIYWIFISVHIYGHVDTLLAAAATFLLSAYLALYPTLALAAASWWATLEGHPGRFLVVVAPLWTLAEWGRGTILTGFPWLASGYAHVGGPLAGFAPILGVYGVTLAAALVAASLARVARAALGRRGDRLILFCLLVGLPLAGSILDEITWSRASGKTIDVRLLQGNIAQDTKFDPERFRATITTYLALIERKPADLIVLPETAFPIFLDDLPDSLIARLHDDTALLHADLAVGVPIADSPRVYTNSVLAFSAKTQATQRYDKSHLVPFGEFVPFGFRWFVDLMHIPLGDFTAGKTSQEPLTLAGERVAFNICYEDLFGEDLIRQAGQANLLINVSNVAWFGDSQALPQHLQLSRMRAIETARPVLRATNTGMTASIDPKGRVVGVLAPYTTDSLDVRIQPVSGTTPYVRLGNLAPLIVCLLLFLPSVVATRKAVRGRQLLAEPAKM